MSERVEVHDGGETAAGVEAGLQNSIAKITECEESFITNGSRKQVEDSRVENSIRDEIQMFDAPALKKVLPVAKMAKPLRECNT